MEVKTTNIPSVLVVEPKVFGDGRGFFFESYQKQRLGAAGLNVEFVQDNVARSTRGVLRGLHYQLARPQGKLVCVTQGEVFDVAVDVRRGSPTFGKWVGEILSDENHRQLWVPPGFAHGYVVLSEIADFFYKVTDYYDPTSEFSIRWDDPAIGIDWPINADNILLSEKDKKGLLLEEMPTENLPEYCE